MGIGHSNHLDIIKEIKFPHSVGLLYAAFTNYLGFKVNSGEYKMMGLAPYGTPRFTNVILENIVDVKTDGSFAINLDFFDYPTGRRMTNEKFHSLFGRVPRKPESNLTQLDMDIAASIQKVTEIIITRLVRSAASTTGAENLCLAGGVALNCVANGKIVKDGYFKNIWIQPAAGDAGGSVGAALAAWHIAFGHKRKISQAIDGMSGAYLGQEFNSLEIKSDLKNSGAVFEFLEDNELIRKTASLLSEGRVVGWFQGRAEFGPRSLGNRSILADPRSKNMQKNLNLKIKFRESFRPFAPSVLREDLEDWFDLGSDSPYMLIVSNVLDKHLVLNNIDTKNLSGIEKLNIVRSVVPAVTHLDNSARVQTIHSQTNPKFHSLISEFKKITGCPVIVNTSFNVRSEPIVNTPQEAYRCFMGTDIDVLVVGNYLMQKTKQPSELAKNYASSFMLD